MNRRQTIPAHLRYTIDNFRSDYPNDDVCLEAIKNQRYPGGVTYCSDCEQERKLYRVAGRTAYVCERGHQFYPLAGTIFEKSTTALHIWFYAMYLMGSTRCGISAKQIQRETGVTYKTAWRMFRQIRSLLSENDMQLEGSTVEIDETYVGGKRKNKHGSRGMRGRDNDEKTPVFGMVERGGKGRVMAFVTPDVKAATLYPIIEEKILPSSTVYTDEYSVYDRLATPQNGYVHRRIKHAEKIYVKTHIPIQVADLLAHETTKVYEELPSDPDAAKKRLEDWLGSNLMKAAFMDAKYLRLIVKGNYDRVKAFKERQSFEAKEAVRKKRKGV